MIIRATFAAAAVALLTASGASATSYSYTQIDVSGSMSTFAEGINDSGAVTGYYNNGLTDLGFIYSDGRYSTLSFQGSNSSSGLKINNDDAVAGTYTCSRCIGFFPSWTLGIVTSQ